LEYQKDCEYFNKAKKDKWDLLYFKLRISDSLLHFERGTMKRGRPSQSPTPPMPHKGYLRLSEHLSALEVRRDKIGHFSMYCDK